MFDRQHLTEAFLHYVWRFKLFRLDDLRTTAGQPLQIKKNGTPNPHAGPDFSNARIQIGDTLWAGNVEIHVQASDWKKHGHQNDAGYDNVILHVVFEADAEVTGKDGQPMPCLTLHDRIDSGLYERYLMLISGNDWIPCQPLIGRVDKFVQRHWLDRLLIERLEERSAAIRERLAFNKNHWEETFYHFLARHFGLKVNSEPFAQLAKSLPLKVLAKHKDQPLQIAALLFGQAGLLERSFKDDYPQQLKKEYGFLKTKYRLTPINGQMWRFLRLRPPNFPTLRLAQFARLIHQSSHLFSKVLQARMVSELREMFAIELDGYWETRYQFDKPSKAQRKRLGTATVNNLLINTVIPFLFIYGKLRGDADLQERAIDFMGQLRPENNTIIRKWKELGLPAQSAYHTQALLQLKTRYCDRKQCLDCMIGNTILRQAAR